MPTAQAKGEGSSSSSTKTALLSATPPAHPAAAQKKPQNDTLGDFDFGEREDGLLGDHSGDEDDILGDLGKPVEELQAVSRFLFLHIRVVRPTYHKIIHYGSGLVRVAPCHH